MDPECQLAPNLMVHLYPSVEIQITIHTHPHIINFIFMQALDFRLAKVTTPYYDLNGPYSSSLLKLSFKELRHLVASSTALLLIFTIRVTIPAQLTRTQHNYNSIATTCE